MFYFLDEIFNASFFFGSEVYLLENCVFFFFGSFVAGVLYVFSFFMLRARQKLLIFCRISVKNSITGILPVPLLPPLPFLVWWGVGNVLICGVQIIISIPKGKC